jgi:hypothetical protein
VHIAVIAEGRAEVVAPPEVPADVRAAATGDWVSAWICLTAERPRRTDRGNLPRSSN